jgi:hypothetical protein
MRINIETLILSGAYLTVAGYMTIPFFYENGVDNFASQIIGISLFSLLAFTVLFKPKHLVKPVAFINLLIAIFIILGSLIQFITEGTMFFALYSNMILVSFYFGIVIPIAGFLHLYRITGK